ncbi:hypothetical protein COUCH_19485 [Couchioplanes caeruleus]|uniref:hypothetical protein n=1 Tax=Couchioplanes caeruleus TaxID=56438 RepID=UPI0020C058B7|nr:hypothetical protein [Couchioplanes caeruleus]UQU61253.1 hypothetical protein COUCH_19485 [Couchioplanes caeruleus]
MAAVVRWPQPLEVRCAARSASRRPTAPPSGIAAATTPDGRGLILTAGGDETIRS